MLSATNKPIMLSVVTLNVVAPLGTMTLNKKMLSITTFSITTYSITMLIIMTLSITMLIIMTLSITIKKCDTA
jgi:hypothetical protein